MDWHLFIAQVVAGAAAGALYFLVASGLTLLWGAFSVINLAHGSFFMIAAFAATSCIAQFGTGMGLVVAVLLVPIAMVGLATVLETTLFRRVYKAGMWGQLLLTFGLVLVLNDLVRTI